MNIVYASDDRFAEMLGISLISLLENNKECGGITVYVLDGGITEENKEKLKAAVGRYNNGSIVFLDVRAHHDPALKQRRGSASTFSRLYLCEMMPEAIEKVLYLDCDLLVLSSLTELYETELGELYGMGVRDCLSEPNLNLIGLTGDGFYFNAGVFLISLRRWREDRAAEKFAEFADRFGGDVPYADQGILNGVLSSGSGILDLKYNVYTVLFDLSYQDLLIFRRPSEYYTEREVKEAVREPVIVHFTTSFLSLRPWVEGCAHPFAGEWLKYKAMSPWAEIPLRKDHRSRKRRLAVRVYRLLPKRLAVRIAGWLHASAIPKMRRWKRRRSQ